MSEQKVFSWNDLIDFANKLTDQQRVQPVNILTYGELVGVECGIILLDDFPEQQLEKGQIYLQSNYE